jgi:hypothetical protein
VYEGVWKDDIAKCGNMRDFDREGAPEPTKYPIPDVSNTWKINVELIEWDIILHVVTLPIKTITSVLKV